MNGPKIAFYLLHDVLDLAFGPCIFVKHVVSVTFLNLTLQFGHVDLILLNDFHIFLQGEHDRAREIFFLEVFLDFFGRVSSVVKCSVYL